MMPNNSFFEKAENGAFLALVALTIRTKDFTDAIELSLKRGNFIKIKKNNLSIKITIEKSEKIKNFANLIQIANNVGIKIPRSMQGDLNEKAEVKVDGYKFIFAILKEKNEKKFIRLKITPDD